MVDKTWSESSNRRLRALLIKRRPVAEIALFLECTATEVRNRMRTLRITAAPGASPAY